MDQDDRRFREGSGGRDDDDLRFSELAAKWVRRAWQEPPAPQHVEVSPGVMEAVAVELRARRRRRRLARWGGGAVAGTAATMGIVALVGILSPRQVPPASRLLTVSQGSADLDGTTSPHPFVSAGDTFGVPDGGTVRIASAAGTELVMASGSRLVVTDASATKRFKLISGVVQVRVAKLLPGERFIIDTPDTEVEVHGTAFRVSILESTAECPGTTVTQVSVSEGVVSARQVAGGDTRSPGRETRLFPRDEWSSSCAPPSVSESERPVPEPKVKRARDRSKARRSVPLVSGGVVAAAPLRESGPAEEKSPAESVSTSVLAEQNDLFSSAVRANRDGRPQEALVRFERFLRRYPSSSLTESALVHRMRLLAGSNPREAAAAATAYLARFSDGFAREEAKSLLGAAATR